MSSCTQVQYIVPTADLLKGEQGTCNNAMAWPTKDKQTHNLPSKAGLQGLGTVSLGQQFSRPMRCLLATDLPRFSLATVHEAPIPVGHRVGWYLSLFGTSLVWQATTTGACASAQVATCLIRCESNRRRRRVRRTDCFALRSRLGVYKGNDGWTLKRQQTPLFCSATLFSRPPSSRQVNFQVFTYYHNTCLLWPLHLHPLW